MTEHKHGFPSPAREADRRRYPRVEVPLLGRCLFSDGREVPVQVENMSAGGAHVRCSRLPELASHVVAYIDHIGRVEGTVSHLGGGGFALEIKASPRKREKLADSLTWLANRNVLGLSEDRRHLRRAPLRPEALLVLPDGARYHCRIIDMSLSGAAIATVLRPKLGTQVRIGRLGARVVRHFEDGIAIEFMRVMSDAKIENVLDEDFF